MLDNGDSAIKLANEYQIGVQTERDTIKNKEKLITFNSGYNDESALFKRKSVKTSTYKYLNSAFLQWFNQKRAEDILISSAMCSEKVRFYSRKELEEILMPHLVFSLDSSNTMVFGS